MFCTNKAFSFFYILCWFLLDKRFDGLMVSFNLEIWLKMKKTTLLLSFKNNFLHFKMYSLNCVKSYKRSLTANKMVTNNEKLLSLFADDGNGLSSYSAFF